MLLLLDVGPLKFPTHHHLLSITNDGRQCCKCSTWSGISWCVCVVTESVLMLCGSLNGCAAHLSGSQAGSPVNDNLSRHHTAPKVTFYSVGTFLPFVKLEMSVSLHDRHLLSLLTANKQNESVGHRVYRHFLVHVLDEVFKMKVKRWCWLEVPRAASVNELLRSYVLKECKSERLIDFMVLGILIIEIRNRVPSVYTNTNISFWNIIYIILC